MVNPSFDDQLKELYEKQEELRNNIEGTTRSIAKYIGLDQKSIKLELSTQHGYCFRVTMKDEKALRNKHGILQVDSSKAGVRFRNKELAQLNTEYLEINAFYEKQQQYVVSEILMCAKGISNSDNTKTTRKISAPHFIIVINCNIEFQDILLFLLIWAHFAPNLIV